MSNYLNSSKASMFYGELPDRSSADYTSALTKVWKYLVTLNRRANNRRALANMGGYLLNDIGVDKKAALEESKKPIWKV